MEILVLTKNEIARPMDGGTLRVRAIVDALEEEGHVVTVLSVREDKKPGVRVKMGRADFVSLFRFLRTGSLSCIKWYRNGVATTIERWRLCNPLGAIVVEYSQLTPYLSNADLRISHLDMHNIESDLVLSYAVSATSAFAGAVYTAESRALRRHESLALRSAKSVSFVSDHDLFRARELAGSVGLVGHWCVSPNGVARDRFDASASKTNTVVFVAHLGWAPNVQAAKWLVNEVWPYVRDASELELALVGRCPDEEVWRLAGMDVKVIADPESVVGITSAALVATAPLLSAGGTRLKIIEALACGTAVVATPMGALGLEQLEGPFMSIAEDPKKFATEILKLARSASRDPEPCAISQLARPFEWSATLRSLVQAVGVLSSPEEVL